MIRSRPQPGERGLELQGLVDGLVHELFDDVFAPRSESTASEAAREALDAREADAVDLGRVAVEHLDAGVGQDPRDLGRLARLEVMVAEDGDARNLERGELADQAARLVGKPVVRQVTAEDQQVGLVVDLREQRLKRASGRRPAVVQITQGSNPDDLFRSVHAPPCRVRAG